MRKWRITGLALAVGLLLSGCSAGEITGKSNSSAAVIGENQVEWAFTKADQHPEEKLVSLIGEAKETLDIAIYSLTYPDIVQAIKDAAKRGVKVRLITDKIQSGGKTQKEALKLLGSAGIPMKINSHSGLMHLKMTLVDGKAATTGSFNYSKSASTTNDEVFVIFRNADIARSFEEQFEAMWTDEKGFETITPTIAMDDSAGSGSAGEEKEEGSDESAAESAAPAACANPEIKGNINSKGDKIYHVPGGAQYEQTKAERMFCTEREAESAGFRKAQK
ncbi:phospholipase D family protein [Cohnella sp. AR92]|uniref:phospholipase D family nuclease n=1 Tax=Cohnella sp. AR92 TaxID=648716 RepID=UPI000F8D1BD8|nr:phospholipase D family protein [Cohnella sp. AR92]RUS48708.1 phospholipase D family protein [Cohnella sp. AR92]